MTVIDIAVHGNTAYIVKDDGIRRGEYTLKLRGADKELNYLEAIYHAVENVPDTEIKIRVPDQDIVKLLNGAKPTSRKAVIMLIRRIKDLGKNITYQVGNIAELNYVKRAAKLKG